MPIDFVILWVDGNDPQWQTKKAQYQSNTEELNGNERYRDYGTLKYWFRMVETNAPWVNKIHFVTDHQVPEWLNTEHSKLHIVNHETFMPKDAVPTFNSNAIQMYIHEIDGLAEHFVLFDDDMFINRPIKPTHFFDKKGQPKDIFGSNVINPVDDFAHLFVNNLRLINQVYNKHQVIKQHFFKFINWRYGTMNLVNLYLLPFSTFTRFYDSHIPYAYLKSHYRHVLEMNKSYQDQTGHHKFRDTTDISHWLVRYDRLVRGEFMPVHKGLGRLQYLGDNLDKHRKLVTISDRDMGEAQFQLETKRLVETFENNYRKSSFEK